jgi:hypothetical protein
MSPEFHPLLMLIEQAIKHKNSRQSERITQSLG